MAFSLMPKTTGFFELFDAQAENLVQGSKLFLEIINEEKLEEVSAERMHALEHKGDEINHEIISYLNETFVTPFDREDVISLAGHMDDIIDGFYLITKRIVIYKIKEIPSEFKKFSHLIDKSVVTLQKMINSLRVKKNMKDTVKYAVEINRLENEGDAMRDTAIMHLFDSAKDPIYIMKWKELYEVAESITDKCEGVANTVETIIVKNN